MKKKLLTALIGLLTMSVTLVGVAYSFFVFEKNGFEMDIESNSINANFNKGESDFYKVYFFASPYYATGAEINGTTINDPLLIAENENNPYDSDEDYVIVGPLLKDDDVKYANAIWPNGNAHYISAQYIDEEKLGDDRDYSAIVPYKKKHFSGYILRNEITGIEQETSKYVVLNVDGNVSSEQLRNVVAQTVFKDHYGFGPEFIGWTYDKNACADRVMYDGQRYKSDSKMKLGDTAGWGIGGTCYQIGNYGFQDDIAQFSSHSSLSYIDNLSLDGSSKGDHVIYLYPVFAAKNYDSSKMIGGESTPIVKFRINPEKDKDGNYMYQYKQSAEVNYYQSRYTVGTFQTLQSSINEPNYFAKDIYFNFNNNSRLKDIRLDVAPKNGETNWSSYWTTILDNDDFKALNLFNGYYDIDISLWSYESISFNEKAKEDVIDVMSSFANTNKYNLVLGSKYTYEPNEYGIHCMKNREDDAYYKYYVSYVIGFKKSIEYHISGESLNGSIDDFISSKNNRFYPEELEYESYKYLYSDSINVSSGDELSILIENKNTSSIPYLFSSMNESDVSIYNTYLDNSSHNNKTHYSIISSESSAFKVNEDGKKIVVNKSGVYDLLIGVKYVNGEPSSIKISYRNGTSKFALFILDKKPTQQFFFDFDELKNDSSFVSVFSEIPNTTISSATIFEGPSLTTTSIEQIKKDYPGKKLFDSATNLQVSYDLFSNNNFKLNRDYVLYLA